MSEESCYDPEEHRDPNYYDRMIPPLSPSALPRPIAACDMQVGDVVRMSHVPNSPWMDTIVVRIEDRDDYKLVHLERPYMRVDQDTLTPLMGIERYSEYASSTHPWVILSRG